MPPLKEYTYQHKTMQIKITIMGYDDAEAEQTLFHLVGKQYFNFKSVSKND